MPATSDHCLQHPMLPACVMLNRKLSETSGACAPSAGSSDNPQSPEEDLHQLTTPKDEEEDIIMPSVTMPPVTMRSCLKRRTSFPTQKSSSDSLDEEQPPRTLQMIAAVMRGKANSRMMNNSRTKPHRLNSECSEESGRSSYGGSYDDVNSSTSNSGTSTSLSSSRKSVSFADSVGEDLCRIKLFKKDKFELEEGYFCETEENWSAKLWRWRIAPYDEDDEDEDQILMPNSSGSSCLNNLVSPPISSNPASSIPFSPSFPSIAEERPPKGEIVATFISPGDLPTFEDRLSVKGIGLETVQVDQDDSKVRGSVRLSQSLRTNSTLKRVDVWVFCSFDNWSTSSRLNTTRTFVDEENPEGISSRFEFEMDASEMRTGDDLEFIVQADIQQCPDSNTFECGAMASSPSRFQIHRQLVDDNDGLKYRLICKCKSKFKPGKSLW